MGEQNKPIGLVIRYADSLMAGKSDTIEEHNKVVDEHGKVFVGKIGRFIGQKAIAICNDEKKSKYLILVKKSKGGYAFYKAKIESGQTAKPPLGLIPEYYRANMGIKSWICISEKLVPLTEKEIKTWIIQSSGMEVAHTLARSMAAYFIAVEKPIKAP
jgi:hypothetical protein